MKVKIKSVIFITLSVVFITLLSTNISANLAEDYQVNLYRARVIEVTEERTIGESVIQTLQIRILNRDLQNHESTITNTLVGNNYDINLSAGDRISVHMELGSDGEPLFYFHSYDRSLPLLFLIIFFALCVIVLGKTKGLKALIALTITISLIFFGLIPLLLRGYNPIILSIIVCILSAIITFSICFGIGKKSISAIIGVSGGLLMGGIIAYLFGFLARITGFSHGDAQMLQYLPNGYMFDFRGLLFAGIIIGALGACLDVAISISSSMTEIKAHNPSIEKKDLINSGFNIGKDIMGSMVNTLVLAYTGSALATIMIFMGFEMRFSEIINLESISTEIVRAIAGSLGLIFAIPITIFAFILLDKSKTTISSGETTEIVEPIKTDSKNS
ncbi:MAG: YibE/F family protein [Oscillospiraceae bacterium]|nr:YibE/F family protein [Oscillospiraceae bacterium]